MGRGRRGGDVRGRSRSGAPKVNDANMESKLRVLRGCIYDAAGEDKDPLAEFPEAMQRLNRNGVDARLEFWSGKRLAKDKRMKVALMRVAERDEVDEELCDPASRLLVVRGRMAGVEGGDGDGVLGFAKFVYTLEGETLEKSSGDTCCIVYEVGVAKEARRKGVGTRLIQMCEMVARKGGVGLIKCFIEKDRATEAGSMEFIAARLKGWYVDSEWNEDAESDRVLIAKGLVTGLPAPKEGAASEVQVLAARIQALSTAVQKPAEAPGGKGTNQGQGNVSGSPVTVLGDGARATKGAAGSRQRQPERLFPQLGSHADAASDDEEGEGWVEDEDPSEDTQLEEIIEELAALFLEKHGRQPSDDEVRRWISELKDAAEEESRAAAEGRKSTDLTSGAAAALAASLD